MQALQLSDNSKTKFHKNHRNTFGLAYGNPEHGGTCPGATLGQGGCLDTNGHKRRTCYVEKIVQIYKAVGKVLENNTQALKGKSQLEMEEILEATIRVFIAKNKDKDLFFRLHWAGDFFSEDYTKAWASTMKKFPNVRFWAYTRSYWFVKHLRDIPNLTLFLSVDPINQSLATAVYEKNKDQKNIGLAWMGNTPPTDRRWVKCPEISGKVQNTPDVGACEKCRLCVNNYVDRVKNIQFPIH